LAGTEPAIGAGELLKGRHLRLGPTGGGVCTGRSVVKGVGPLVVGFVEF